MNLEQEDRLNELKDKVANLQQIITDGKEYVSFKESGFYHLFDRTLRTQKEIYQADAYKAAKSNLSNLGAFLGRMEMIDDLYSILEKFETNANQAASDLDMAEAEIKDIQEELNKPEVGTIDQGGTMG